LERVEAAETRTKMNLVLGKNKCCV
jgi:hypothetical protein